MSASMMSRWTRFCRLGSVPVGGPSGNPGPARVSQRVMAEVVHLLVPRAPTEPARLSGRHNRQSVDLLTEQPPVGVDGLALISRRMLEPRIGGRIRARSTRDRARTGHPRSTTAWPTTWPGWRHCGSTRRRSPAEQDPLRPGGDLGQHREGVEAPRLGDEEAVVAELLRYRSSCRCSTGRAG